MSEKIFLFLLRLYPAGFRRRYGAEAMRLLRDRLRDERGITRRARLWFDLLLDFATGVRLAYRNSYAMVSASPVPHGAVGLPEFRVLDQEPLRPESILMGSLLALAALAAFVFVMNHASGYHPFSHKQSAVTHSNSQSSSSAQQVAEKLDEQIQTASAPAGCGFERLELHPGNIGYVKLNWFPDLSVCGQITEAVMQRLNETDAIIFDLRDNHGGFPETVRLLAGYLFDHPVPWYNPRATSPQESFTNSPVRGSELTKKPVFILTSRRTFSGGEHFAYDLKTLKRATLVGETTSGASHGAGPPPQGTKPVWEGAGVEPDVKVKADDALQIAERLARSEIKK